MAGLRDIIFQTAGSQPALSEAQKKKLYQQLGYTGKKDKVTLADIKKGKKAYTSEDKKLGGKEFGDYLSLVAGGVKRGSLDPATAKYLEKKGYQKYGGAYSKLGTVGESTLKKAASAGYSGEDVRASLAKQFSQGQLSDAVSKFITEGDYKIDPKTGKYAKAVTTAKVPKGKPTKTSTVTDVFGTDIYGDPDKAKGSTIQEILYASLMDPVKLAERGSERRAKLAELGAGARALLAEKGAGSRAITAEKGARERALIDYQKTMNAAQVDQATSLYGLIPYGLR